MKKRIMTILTAGLCVAMCVSAFTLPNRANNSLRKTQGIVQEREVPSEYMADFVSASNDLFADDKAIALTVDQQQELVETISRRFLEEIDIALPEGLEFEYDASLMPTFDFETNSLTEIVNVRMSAQGAGNLLFYASLDIPGFPEDLTAAGRSYIEVNGINSSNYHEILGIAGQDAVQEFTSAARQKSVENFGIDVPEGFEFDYRVSHTPLYGREGEGEFVIFTIMGNYEAQQGMTFLASYTASDFLNKQADLNDLRAGRINNPILEESYGKIALEALQNELGLSVPDYYTLVLDFMADGENGQLDPQLTLYWFDPETELDKGFEGGYMFSSKEMFGVTFNKLDLTEHTGRIIGARMFIEYTQTSLMEEWQSPGFVRFTEEQMNEMLEAAKGFLTEKGIGFGDLYRSLQITMEGNPVMDLFFESSDINETFSRSVNVTITQDLRVLGYYY